MSQIYDPKRNAFEKLGLYLDSLGIDMGLLLFSILLIGAIIKWKNLFYWSDNSKEEKFFTVVYMIFLAIFSILVFTN